MAQAISRFRQSLGDTQQQFAARTGLSVTSVARYETNSRPSTKVLARFANIAREANFPAFVGIFEQKIAPEQELDLQNFSAVKQLLERLGKRLHPRQLASARLALACLLTPGDKMDELEKLLKKFLPVADEALDRAASEIVRTRNPEVEEKRLRFLKTREIEDWLDFSKAYDGFRAAQTAKAQSGDSAQEPIFDLFSVEVKSEGGAPFEITESTVFVEEWEDEPEQTSGSETGETPSEVNDDAASNEANRQEK